MSVHEHKARSDLHLRGGIITVSDTRTEADDRSGDLLARVFAEAGHEIAWRKIVADEQGLILKALDEVLARDDSEFVVLTGGTGVSPRDRTPEAVRGRFNLELPGFGELFRMLSYEEIGAAAMLSRATAGLVGDKPVFVIPGSTKASELAATKIIIPELGHLVSLARPKLEH